MRQELTHRSVTTICTLSLLALFVPTAPAADLSKPARDEWPTFGGDYAQTRLELRRKIRTPHANQVQKYLDGAQRHNVDYGPL